MSTELLIEYGEVIGYVLVGVLALVSLGVIQLMRRRGDVKRARVAVRLATYSISDPRPGPIAVTGSYHQSQSERWVECGGQRVVFDGELDVVRGTRGRWRNGVRSYTVRDGDDVIAIGVMSKAGAAGWRLVPSPGEAGVQLFARNPAPAPPPLWPWRAPLILAVCGGIAFLGCYQIGRLLIDMPRNETACGETSTMRLQIAAALPLAREDALVRLERCR